MIGLTDVTLRDGLQMESRVFSSAEKLSLLEKLLPCGYDRFEITSFVNPKWVPQFADADAFVQSVSSRFPQPEKWMAFVPNERGLERLLAHPIGWAAAFVAVTESFNRKNVNQDISTTLAGLSAIATRCRAEKRKLRVYLSTAFGCPYEGKVSVSQTVKLIEKIAAFSPDEIALSDTIGVALPAQIRETVRASQALFPISQTALHVHHTYGMGLTAAIAGVEAGIRLFDGSTGGTGGCPYAKGASGNVAIEDLAHLFFRLGERPAPDTGAIMGALQFLQSAGTPVRSHLGAILLKGGAVYGG